ncbi:MAG: hypothetical protein NZ520_00740, partial [bacterium]|nr:hypothetical protein [bacterium]
MVQFTGHPIVDYGRVSLRCMSDDGDDLSTAVAQLSDLLCADPEGTARLYSAYLPNSVFSNPGSSKTREQDIRLFLQTLLHMTGRRGKGNFVCSLCGALCPEDAILHARKDKIPFLLGDINFYPLLASGLSVCALCGLAVVAALPAMMQAASTFLFMHVQDQSALAGIIQRNLSVVRAHALARQLQLHNYPDARSPEAALLRALYELLTQDYSAYLRLERSRYPKTLWSIRSGNRTDDTRINYLSVPHRVLVFLDKLVNY